MFIVLIGPQCSGKRTTLEYLVQEHGFQPLTLDSQKPESFQDLHFNTVQTMHRFVTQRWRENFVTCDVRRPWDITLLKKRPFVLLVAVDAPLMLRYNRLVNQAPASSSVPSLEAFIAEYDQNQFVSWSDKKDHVVDSSSSAPPLYKVISQADVYVVNAYQTVKEFNDYLTSLDLLNGERLRPSWDTYFMLLSELASHRSNCMKRRVGCILVKDNRIIATGYNGCPKGITNCNNGGCPRCNEATPCGQSLDHCLCLHAEENALLEAGRARVEGYGRCILYCNTCPCLGCAKKIVQVGVQEVVYSQAYGMDELSARLFQEAGIILRQHSPPQIKLDIHAEPHYFV